MVSSPTTNEFEPQINSQEAQEKRDHRQAAREENSRDQVYNLQSIFADQHTTSKGVGYTMNGQSKKNVGQSDLTPFQEFLKEIRDRPKQDNRGLKKVNPTNEPPQNKDVPELQARFSQYNNGLKKAVHTSEPPQNKDESELQKKFNQVEARLLKKTQAGVKAVAESEIPNSDEAKWDSTYDPPLHNDSGFEEELEALEALSKELNAREENKVGPTIANAGSKKYLNIENEQIDSETVKLNNAQSNPADQVMSELKEALKEPNTNKGLKPTPQVSEKNIPLVNAHDPFSDCIEDKRSNLHKLLEEDKAQSKIGVLEGEREDGLTKPTINCDRNKVALATQCIELSTKIQQLWVEQATVLSRENDKGII